MYETPTIIDAGAFGDLTRQTHRGYRNDYRRHRNRRRHWDRDEHGRRW